MSFGSMSWMPLRFLVPDEDTLEMTIDKDSSEVYQTYSYGTLLWPRLFDDDILLGAPSLRSLSNAFFER